MPSHGVRRVAGLRREEVSVLAGVNADYYTRLEQGRERHPSAQVVNALSRALRLDTDARTHLHQLAGTTASQQPAATSARVDPALRVLLSGYPDTPAFVIDPSLNVLAANAPAQALYSPFEPMDNLARMVFLTPAGRPFHSRWDQTAETVVGHLRQAYGIDPGSAQPRELIAELNHHSADFARMWRTHTVRGKTREEKYFRHPDAGAITLTYHAFDVREAPGQQLIIYHAELGSPSAEALRILGATHTTTHQE